MIFLDASVIVAVLAREADSQQQIERLRNMKADRISVSPLVRYEATTAMARVKAMAPGNQRPTAEIVTQARQTVDTFLAWLEASDVEITPDIGAAAIEASALFGKLVGHPAALNFGDCFAYACAKSLGVPLAYKGDDFARTDLA